MSQKWRRSRDIISGQYITLSLIIIPTPNNCLWFNQKLAEHGKCALLLKRSLERIALLLVTFENKQKRTKKKKIDLIELPCRNQTTFTTSEPVHCEWDLSQSGGQLA